MNESQALVGLGAFVGDWATKQDHIDIADVEGCHPYFVGPPSVAQGGQGSVVSGCPACKKRINSMSQFLDHLANDAMPSLLDRLSSEQGGGKNGSARLH